MANKQALRDLQTRLAERMKQVRSETPGVSWLAVDCAGQGLLLSLKQAGEIFDLGPLLPVPHTQPWLAGVVNLRGVIVPIVDLRVKLGCDTVEYNEFTVVIVLNVAGRVVGAVVDSVSDVLELPKDAVKPAPELASSVDTSFITGIGNVGDRMLILMDIEAFMSSTDMCLISEVH